MHTLYVRRVEALAFQFIIAINYVKDQVFILIKSLIPVFRGACFQVFSSSLYTTFKREDLIRWYSAPEQ